MKIAVLMGGNSAEREVSLHSGEAVVEALQGSGIDVFTCDYEGDIRNFLSKLSGADVVFMALHGGEGENGIVQGVLEEESIIYTGSGPDASVLAMDKVASKKVMIENDIPTPDWEFFTSCENFEASGEKNRNYPLIVKPNGEGSTVGLTIVKSEAELLPAVQIAEKCGSGILLEDYIPGRELTIGILGEEALPCIEILPLHDHYDYECKYTAGMSNYICPAEMSTVLASQLAQSSLDIHNLLGCRHYSRVDYRLSPEGSFFCLEVNTLPGLTDTSLVPKAAAVMETPFEDFVLKLCTMALHGS